MGTARLLIAVEDQGVGTQYVRFRVWPKFSSAGITVIAVLATVAGVATTTAAWRAAIAFASVDALVIARVAQEAGRALAVIERAIAEMKNLSGGHAM